MDKQQWDFRIAELVELEGPCLNQVKPSAEQLNELKNKVPAFLMHFWETQGWGSYFKGLLRYVNPQTHQNALAEWIAGTPLEGLDRFHVFARNAFGSLYVYGEEYGHTMTVHPSNNFIFAFSKDFQNEKNAQKQDEQLLSFLMGEQEDFDLEDSNGKSMFDAAVEKLGPLESDEIYGFEPALIAGGSLSGDNLKIVKWEQHLSILRSLSDPTLPGWNMDLKVQE